MSKQLSASALQIEEKRKRKIELLGLAQTTTYADIVKLVEENPKISEDATMTLIKQKGIPKKEFLNEYVNEKFDVKIETVRQYFREYRDSLRPRFVEFRKDRKRYFHLAERILKPMVQQALKPKDGKPKMSKKPKPIKIKCERCGTVKKTQAFDNIADIEINGECYQWCSKCEAETTWHLADKPKAEVKP